MSFNILVRGDGSSNWFNLLFYHSIYFEHILHYIVAMDSASLFNVKVDMTSPLRIFLANCMYFNRAKWCWSPAVPKVLVA